MKITRRGFLKLSGATAIGVTIAKMGLTLTGCKKYTENPSLRTQYAEEFTTICPYCGGGCGQIIATKNGKVINTEGDPDHPINEGAQCSKGNALFQVLNNPQRLSKVLYRAPGSKSWEEKDWDWAIERIALNIKNTRDANWINTEDGIPVNSTEAIANLGGAALDNEECYLISKAMRSLGIVYLEHQARI